MTSKEDETLMRGRLPAPAAAVATVTALAAATAAFAAADQRFPQGRFTSPLVAADFTRYSGSMDPSFPHPWIITMRRERWQTNEQPPYGGRYLIRGNRVTFVIQYPASAAGTRQTLTWAYRHKRLRFKIVSGVEGGDQAIYLAHPWRPFGP
jgi:hypothetical protein